MNNKTKTKVNNQDSYAVQNTKHITHYCSALLCYQFHVVFCILWLIFKCNKCTDSNRISFMGCEWRVKEALYLNMNTEHSTGKLQTAFMYPIHRQTLTENYHLCISLQIIIIIIDHAVSHFIEFF